MVSLLYKYNIYYHNYIVYFILRIILFIDLYARNIKFDGSEIGWLYLVLQIVPNFVLSPLAKFGYFKSRADDPLKDLKAHLGRYATYMPYMKVFFFRVTSIEGKSVIGLETVLKILLRKCRHLTFPDGEDINVDYLDGILNIH